MFTLDLGRVASSQLGAVHTFHDLPGPCPRNTTITTTCPGGRRTTKVNSISCITLCSCILVLWPFVTPGIPVLLVFASQLHASAGRACSEKTNKLLRCAQHCSTNPRSGSWNSSWRHCGPGNQTNGFAGRV